MSLNIGINQISSNKWANVNLSSLEEVTNKILERSGVKATTNNTSLNIDYSKFNRIDQGIDLYNPKTDINVQRQIASANSSLNNVNINTSYFNAQAAAALYSPSNIVKNIEGRMTIGISEGEVQQLREVVPLPKSTQVFNTANLSKDKRGSNPFATFTSVKDEEKASDNSLDILG